MKYSELPVCRECHMPNDSFAKSSCCTEACKAKQERKYIEEATYTKEFFNSISVDNKD